MSRRIASILLMSFLFTGIVVAQDTTQPEADPDTELCRLMVEEAVSTVSASCDGLRRNQACYGHNLIDAQRQPTARDPFEDEGDIIALGDLTNLRTSQLDLETGTWGIATLRVQASLPDSSPENLTLLIFGDAQLASDETRADSFGSMQAFIVDVGDQAAPCAAAPESGLLIQTPEGIGEINLLVNEVDIRLGSTALLNTGSAGELAILIPSGYGIVTAQGVTTRVEAGQVTQIGLGGGPRGAYATTPPQPVRDYDPARIRNMPYNLLPNHVRVTASYPWTDTDIIVRAGQRLFFSVVGRANICAQNSPDCQSNPAAAGWYEAGGNTSWAPCDGSLGACQLMPAPFGALVARIGESPAFLVGSGGEFTAPADGVLQLGVNDYRYDDNDGAYYILITLDTQSQIGESYVPDCLLMARAPLFTLAGPGFEFERYGRMPANTPVRAIAQATGSDEFNWWRLATGGWLPEDIFSSIEGDCARVPRPSTAN